jgi:adenine-specific DNA-methyltransferase
VAGGSGNGERRKAQSKPSGQLILNWTNKDQALLAHEDGSYEWVPKRDRRVAEVRLLHEAGSVGEVFPEPVRVQDNLLIRGDSLNALTALTKLPEFAAEYEGKVKLCYLDPPFNTGQSFEHYDDGLEHSVWLTMMRDRLALVKKLLAPNGSVWVHLDDAEVHRCRLLMDEEFGRDNYVATVIWKRRNDVRNTAPFLSANHDYVLVYAANPARLTFNQLPRTEEMDARYSNPDNDPRGPWLRGNLNARNYYSKGLYSITSPTGRVVEGPPDGSYWRVSKQKFEEMAADNRIYWGSGGEGQPYIKRFLNEVQGGRVPETVWDPEEVGFVRQGKQETTAVVGVPFDTPKPERFMQRVIQIGSNPGDIVLDCFAGSGTTAAVAHKMGRRWITVERSRKTVQTFTAPRLQKVVAGEDPGGITDATQWEGGGGFRVLDIAPSMYEEDAGVVVLAQWAVNGQLAEAVAAQLGFKFDPDGIFAGRKGKMRLIVLDGHGNAELAKTFVELLAEGERLTLCATSLDPEVPELLRRLRTGSRVRIVPEDLLIAYATASPWRVSVANALDLVEADADTSNGDGDRASTEAAA